MEWVFDNLENVIVPIIILILYGLGNAAQGKKKKRKKRRLARQAKGRTDEAARRAREIKEEIQRKIAQRGGGPSTPPPLHQEPPPPELPPFQEGPIPAGREIPWQTEELPEQAPSPVAEPLAPPEPPVLAPMDSQVLLEDIEDKLRQTRALPARMRQRAEPVATTPRLAPLLLAKDSLRGQLFRDLAHPLGQRKAILVSEILGKPLGLKGPANRRAKW